jgi:hypothetical protein
MKYDEFKSAISSPAPPAEVSIYLKALWYDAKNDWEQSHNIIQEYDTKTAFWIHAYLHRKEGDPGNASYWYQKAGRKMPGYDLEKEWEEIVKQLLDQ